MKNAFILIELIKSRVIKLSFMTKSLMNTFVLFKQFCKSFRYLHDQDAYVTTLLHQTLIDCAQGSLDHCPSGKNYLIMSPSYHNTFLLIYHFIFFFRELTTNP